jgi:hypothetical protein
LKILFFFFTKQATLMGRPSGLSLPLQLVFHGEVLGMGRRALFVFENKQN